MTGRINALGTALVLVTGFLLSATLVSNNARAATWDVTLIETVGTGTYDKQTSIALDSLGYPHIAYEEWNNYDVKHAWWNGTGWKTEIVDGPGQVGFWPSIAIDAGDNLHISYSDMMNSDLKYAIWNGTAWTITVPDSSGSVGEYSSIAVDKNGRPHISYRGSGVGLKYASWNGTAWNISVVDTVSSSDTSLALDSNDLPHIAYQNRNLADLKFASWNGSAWNITTVDSAGNVGADTSLAIDSNDLPYISYYDYSVRDLKYAHWNGTTWVVQTVDSAGDVGRDTSIALDWLEHPRITYYDWTNTNLKFASWNGTAWGIEVIDALTDTGRCTSLVIDAGGYEHIGYYDDTWSALKYARRALDNPPDTPSVPSGPVAGNPVTPYTYSTSTTDADGDKVMYVFDWDDGNSSQTGFLDSGTPANLNHSWANPGIYYVRAMARDVYGASSNWSGSLEVNISTSGLDFPSAPLNLTVTNYIRNVTIAWLAPLDDGGSPITRYTVYRGVNGPPVWRYAILGNISVYVDTAVSYPNNYSYAVTANNSIGEGPKSNEASTVPITTPSPPTLPKAMAGDRQVTLNWSEPVEWNGAPITSYSVYRGTISGGEAFLASWPHTGPTEEFVDTGLVNGQTYFYYVTAWNLAGEGGSSNEVNATPAGKPGAPTALTAVAGVRQVTLMWSPPGDNGGSPITNFRIYRGTAAGGETFLTEIGSVSSFVDSAVAAGRTYYYTVSAMNTVGEGPQSAEANATPLATLPGAPLNLTVTNYIRNITIAWLPPLDDGGSPITNYTVYRRMNSGLFTRFAILGNVTEFTDLSVYNPNIYSYVVSANNSIGEGPGSNLVGEVPVSCPSPSFIIDVVAGDRQITLNWTEPFEDNGAPVTRYSVYRGTTSGGEAFLATRVYTGIIETFVDTGLANGQTYFYYVTAWNLAGEGAKSNEVNATPAARPGAPTALTAVPDAGQVMLTWLPPSNDGGSPVTNFRIYRGTAAGGETFLTEIGNVPNYTDTGLTNGQAYYYQVSAKNVMGEGPRSAEATATPPTIPGEPTGLMAVAGNREVSLTWVAPADTGGSTITGYGIYRGVAPGMEVYLLDAGLVLTYLDAGLTNGVTYYYQVAAKNVIGESQRSAEVYATPATVPGPPTGLGATAGEGEVVLTWSPPASDGGSAVINYLVYRGSSSGGEILLVTLGNVLAHTDTGLTNGATYYYTVAAVNGVGQGPNSTEVNATPATTPSEPSITWIGSGWNTAMGEGEIDLCWSAPASDGGSPITHYRIYRGTEPGSLTLLEEIGNVLEYNDTSVVPSQIYYYRVSAVNAVGEGPKSDEANETLEPRSPPPGPTKSILEEPWFWAIVAVVIIALVSLFAIILRRKKGRQQKKEPPETEEQASEEQRPKE